MFYAILPTTPPVFAVQPDALQMAEPHCGELLIKLQLHFMHEVVLVHWGEDGECHRIGKDVSEDILLDEDLVWREFDLMPEPEIPF